MRFFYLPLFIIMLINFKIYSQSYSVEGRVLEIETQKPIEDCIILLAELKEQITYLTTTDSAGRFSFQNIMDKFVEISVNKMTYDGARVGPIRLKKGKKNKFKIILTPVPHYTDEVLVESKADVQALKTAGFYQRKTKGLGQFVTIDDIKEKRFYSLRQLISLFPKLGVSQKNLIFNKKAQIGLNGNANVSIFIDGVYFNQIIKNSSIKPRFGRRGSAGSDAIIQSLDAILNLEDISGAEFYDGSAEIPVQYSKFNSGAGVLLIWTR